MTATGLETLDAVLRRRAAELPHHVAYRFLQDGETESHAWTYAALDRKSRALAVRLLALGTPGQPVLLVYDDSLEPLAAFFGCLYAGMIAVPLAPPRPRQPVGALGALAAEAGARVVLTSQRLLPRYQDEPDLRHLHRLSSETVGDDDPGAEAWRATSITPDDTAALVYTSGSTSQPKGVMLSHQVLWGPPFKLPPGIDPDWTLNSISQNYYAQDIEAAAPSSHPDLAARRRPLACPRCKAGTGQPLKTAGASRW